MSLRFLYEINDHCGVIIKNNRIDQSIFFCNLRFRATGYVTMKVGKMAAVAVGGGIIILQVANQQGYIKIDWNKINKKIDKVSDKVEEAVTGEGPNWMDKVNITFIFQILNVCRFYPLLSKHAFIINIASKEIITPI